MLGFLLGTAGLIGIVFLAPHGGQPEDRSFCEVAQVSTWGRFGEWLAAWCSLKIILLGLGIYLLLRGVDEALLLFCRRSFSIEALLTLTIIPILVFGVGFFFLAKALL